MGPNGSGGVFFSRCTMCCLYCQNSPWSWKGAGEDVTTERLTEIFRELATERGCNNWNLISPTPYLPFIREALSPLFKEGVRLPLVYNTSGYERVETLEEYADLADIALCDLRYASDETAKSASGAPGYVAASRAAISHFWNRLGKLDSDEPGKAKRGVVCRILVLPGHADEAVENLAWLATNLSNEVHVSVMSQYTPAYRALSLEPWNRGVTEEEYAMVTEAAADFGFENGWIQGFESRDPDAELFGENMPSGSGSVGKDEV